MSRYFEWGYDEDPFVLFSLEHWLTITVFVFIAIGIALYRKPLRKGSRPVVFRFCLAGVLLLSEISYQSWQIYYGQWNPSYSLPLHLSSVSLIFAIIMLLTKNERVFAFTYFVGIGSAIQAMLTPVIDGYSFPHCRYIHFYVAHGGVVIACLYMLFVERFRPTLKLLWRSFLYLNVYTAFMYFINLWTGGNYMFIMRKPSTASVLDFLGPWPWYIIPLELIALASFLILWFPVWVVESVSKKSLEP